MIGRDDVIHVNADNFVQAETYRMFRDIQAQAGGVGTFRHNRTPARIDEPTVVGLNRDTLYSFAVVDLAEADQLTLPDADDRYLSAMIVNEDHFVNDVFHEASEYTLTSDQYGSRYVLVGVRYWSSPTTPEMWPPSRRFRTASRSTPAHHRRLSCRTTISKASTRPGTLACARSGSRQFRPDVRCARRS